MNQPNLSESISFVLSREELLFVLNLLQAEFIPGLDADPLGELTTEQQEVALTVAGRALWARELAQLPSQDEWVIHNTLLMAVGSCAYAQSIISVYHWSPTDVLPSRFYGHVRADNIVTHTRPAEVLHRFALLSSKDQLFDHVLAACDYEDEPAASPQELAVSGADFVKVRELAGAGDTAGAVDLLVTRGVAPETAEAFLSTLTSAPRVSILQLVKQPDGGPAQKQDMTMLQNGRHTWLMTTPSDDPDNAPLSVKSTTKEELRAVLAEWLL